MGIPSFALRLRLQIYTFERYSECQARPLTALAERFSSAAINSIGLPASTSIRSRLSSSGVQKVRANAATSPLPSAPTRPGGAYSNHTSACERLARFVSAYERSDAGPFSNRVTPKVARHPRASKVGQLGAGLASFRLRFQPPGQRQIQPLSLGLNRGDRSL